MFVDGWINNPSGYSKSPTDESSSCRLLRMWTCVPAPGSMSAVALTTVLFKGLECKIKKNYVPITCVGSIINLLQYSV